MLAFVALHLWQSTLVLVAAWLLTLACRRNAAAIRYWIWFAASAKFLVPFALLQGLGDSIGRLLPQPIPLDSGLIESGSALFVPAVSGLLALPDSMLPYLTMALGATWALGSAASLLRWFLQWRAVHSTVASASPLSMDLPVPVRVTSGELTPGVFGVFQPIVILPRTVIDALSEREMQAVLAHEVCHIRRRDNLTAAIHKCVEALFWFHPLVRWIGANLLREREAACDESVIEEGHEQAVYAESILHVCRLGVAARYSGIAASTGGNLTQRMSSIMSKQRVSPLDHGRFALLFTTAILALYGPFAVGVFTGAIREASNTGPIAFEAIKLAPSTPGWWRRSQFDLQAGRLSLQNVSLRDLIALGYPSSQVNADRQLTDRVHYDIEARWSDRSGASERHVYRELLKRVLQTNSNLQLHVIPCDRECG